jgi:hypothetical protein
MSAMVVTSASHGIPNSTVAAVCNISSRSGSSGRGVSWNGKDKKQHERRKGEQA